jgi:putative membrane protein insertion efficiency factor
MSLVSLFGRLLIGLIRVYQWTLSPFLPASCRYHPGCASYAAEAIARHGPVQGLWLAVKRIGRCHPWGGMGLDPVPPKAADTTATRQPARLSWEPSE